MFEYKIVTDLQIPQKDKRCFQQTTSGLQNTLHKKSCGYNEQFPE